MANLDALSKLPLFEWRDRQYPITERQVSFQHEGATHRLQYRDNDFIEQLGSHSLSFRYTLPLRQGIASGPYKELFTVDYPILFGDCRNRERGRLLDPVLGEVWAVPVSWSDDMDVAKRDGTDIRIEFIHSPDVDESSDLKSITIQGVGTEAGALDAELSKVDWQQEPSPEPSMDALNAISGFGAQLEAQGGKFSAALDDFAYKNEKIEQQIDRLQNPDVWPLKRAARRNRAAAADLGKRAQDPTKEIVQTTLSHGRALSVLAAEVGMSLQQLLELNPGLARSPHAPSGYVVNVARRRGRAA